MIEGCFRDFKDQEGCSLLRMKNVAFYPKQIIYIDWYQYVATT